MRVTTQLVFLTLLLLPRMIFAQSASVNPGGGFTCTSPEIATKTLNFSGTWEGTGGDQVVARFAPVYGQMSPTWYFSPGPSPLAPSPPTGETDPGSTDGGISVPIPKVSDGENLLGVYVWFEYGRWTKSSYWLENPLGSNNWIYYEFWGWNCKGQLCDWCWIPNSTSTCFPAGTHLLTPQGSRPIEQLKVGDEILTSPRNCPDMVPTAQRITKVIASRSKLLELVVNGQSINTTNDHPFFTKSRGWTPAHSVLPGDFLRSDSGWKQVDSVRKGFESTVFNVVVDGKSAYFVGREDWGFAIWAADGCDSRTSEPNRTAKPLFKAQTIPFSASTIEK